MPTIAINFVDAQTFNMSQVQVIDIMIRMVLTAYSITVFGKEKNRFWILDAIGVFQWHQGLV